ncbi:hypothetical protein [Bacillus phage Hakuna]|uniref:Uncharacterized protein n=1 Tax=Bacillus phage Hakuna TaxID=1486659 RepID=A0A024B0S6_9CAUD|nr:hypothetical protein FP72_gp052 [Bacillus phage Hakuna]AHZ10070.1 hypothetical protein [Bacillus phage Hakuna]
MDTRAFVVFNEIKTWEVDNGESFIDHYGYNIDAPDFMEWALEKKLITEDQFAAWEDAYPSLEADDPNYYIFTDDEDVAWALVVDPERTEESEDKGLIYLSNYIAERDELLEEFRVFIDEEERD